MKGYPFEEFKLLEEKSIESCHVQNCYLWLKKSQTHQWLKAFRDFSPALFLP